MCEMVRRGRDTWKFIPNYIAPCRRKIFVEKIHTEDMYTCTHKFTNFKHTDTNIFLPHT